MNLFVSILWLIGVLILYSICKLIIKPYLDILWYKKQGIPISYFFPLLGFVKLLKNSFNEHGDAFYALKLLKHETPSHKIYAMNLGTSVYLLITETNLIKECLLNHDIFVKEPLMRQSLERLFGVENIGLSEGIEWKKSRKIISNSFNFEFLKESIPIISEVSEKHFGSILNMETLNLKHELQSLTLQILMEVFFRGGLSNIMYKGNSLATVLGKLANELMDQTNSLPNFIFGKKFFELGLRKKDREVIEDIQAVRSIIKNYVKEQKDNKMYLNDNGLLSNLLKNEEILKKTGVSDSLERITNEVIAVFFAGSDTTSHLLLNCFILLQKYPNCSKKLQLEIQKFRNDILTQENINKLDYLTAFLKEVLRFWGPLQMILPRIMAKTCKIGEFVIKKGTAVNFPLVSNFYDPEFFKDPFEFNPDRWLDKNDTSFLANSDPYLFIPFSAGPRNCVGQHLANLEARIILILFFRKYEMVIKNKEVKMNWRFMYEPDEDINFQILKK